MAKKYFRPKLDDLHSPFFLEEREEVNKILSELNINFDKTKVIEVGNKCDLIDEETGVRIDNFEV